MEPWQWAALLKAPILFLLCLLVLYPARRWVMRRMPDGKLKRFLLFRTN